MSRLMPLDIHAGERLVEYENIRHGLKRQRPAARAAARRPKACPMRLSMSASPCTFARHAQHLFLHGFCRAQERGALEDAAGEKVHHAHGVAAVKGRALRHIADAQLRLLAAGLVEGDLPFIFPLAQNGADERGLTAPFGPISATIWPQCICRSMLSRIVSPPIWTDRCSIFRQQACSQSPACGCRCGIMKAPPGWCRCCDRSRPCSLPRRRPCPL